jgi:hypothetical protein
LKNARDRARIYSVDFALTVEDLGVAPTHCPVLGLKLSYPGTGLGRQPNSASLDRLDNRTGYVKGNVAIISWRANKIKGDASLEELKSIVSYMENKHEK